MTDTYRILPLVWRKERAGFHMGIGLDISYGVWKSKTGNFFLWGDFHGPGKRVKTLKAGKLAAEAHYVSRLAGPGGCLERVETTENTQ